MGDSRRPHRSRPTLRKELHETPAEQAHLLERDGHGPRLRRPPGGTACAATAALPKNSVTSAALAPNSVGLGEMKSDSVGTAELVAEAVGLQQLQDESVNASKIKNGSVTLAKLSAQAKAELEGPKGAAGAQGPAGPQGSPGTGSVAVSTAVETEVIDQATATDTSTPKELSVSCPNGPVLGGGYVLHHSPESPTGDAELRAIRSYPVTASTWLVRAVDDSSNGPWELTVSIVCEK
jgi:hypothetical protein